MQPWGALWWLMASAALASIVGMLVVAQSIRTTAELASMKNDFVATVTHDSKTPLALIKVVGETLEFGRYTSEDRIDEYGKLLRLEATRLSLRIDNLLAYARGDRAAGLGPANPVDLLEVIHEALHGVSRDSPASTSR